VDFAAGAHEAGADGGDADTFVAEFGVEAFGEADEGELAGDVWEHVRHGELAADAGDVDDGGVAVDRVAVEEVGKRGVGGVEGGEEVGGHGAAIGGDRLVFNGADLDDTGVVYEDIDAAEVADGVVDEHGGLGGVGEVAWKQEDIVGGLDGFAREESVAGVGEFFYVAGDEDDLCSGAAVAVGEGEAETTGASGDEYDPTGAALWRSWPQRIGSGCGDDAGENLSGMEYGSGCLHNCLDAEFAG